MQIIEALKDAIAAWKKTSPATRADRVSPDVRYEWPDPTPMELPVQLSPAPNTLAKLLAEQRMVQAQALALQQIEESYEDADDFDVDGFEGAIEYAKTKWEIAADAAALTPKQLFENIYGIKHEDAYPPEPPPPSVETPKPSPSGKRKTPPPDLDGDGE